MAAAAAATCANGQSFESLHAWNALSEVLRRQPVSPMMTTIRVSALGSGRAWLPTLARNTPSAKLRSQVSTGNTDGFDSAGSLRVGRSAMVAAGARTFIGTATSST